MAQRIRSISVDNTVGKIFTGITTLAAANATNLIAGTQKLVKSFSTASTVTTKVATNLAGTTGLVIGNSGILTNVVLLASTAPVGGTGIIINLKKGSAYSTSTIVGTYALGPTLTTVTYNVAISFLSTDSFFLDVAQVGSTKAGSGFSIQLNYYTGY
jgi:hypothetical protein